MKENSLFFMNNRFVQIIQDVEAISLATNEHPVALLAEHTKKLLQRDNTIYMHILSQRPNAAAVSASILHKLYGINLKPFFGEMGHLKNQCSAMHVDQDGGLGGH